MRTTRLRYCHYLKQMEINRVTYWHRLLWHAIYITSPHESNYAFNFIVTIIINNNE